MPTASQSQVISRKQSNVRASSPQILKRKFSQCKEDVGDSQTYRYQITSTHITEVKITNFKGDGKGYNLNFPSSNRKIKPLPTGNSPYKKIRKLDGNKKSYSYNEAILARNPSIVSDLDDTFEQLAHGLPLGVDKAMANMENSKITSTSTVASSPPAFDPSMNVDGGGGIIVARDGFGVRTRATALDIWGRKGKVPAYFVANIDKARFRLKTDALNMASHQLKMPTKNIWKALLAEFIGTMILVFVGCGSIISLDSDSPKPLSLTGIGLCWGLTVATLAQTLGHVSGCHLNPAVTLGMVVTGKIQLIKAGLYIVVQCIGSMVGAVVLKALTPDNIKGDWGITMVNPNITPLQGFGIEFITTFVLLLVIFGATDENRNDIKGSAPLSIGLAITALIYYAGPFTGASFNPARSLGPSIVAGKWNDHWVYWIGPIGGAVTAATLYQNVLRALSIDEIEALHAEEEESQRSTETKANVLPTV